MNIDLSTKEEINLRLHQLGAYFAIKLRDEPTSANRELYEICNALIDRFNTLQSQWIPVSERLPNRDECIASNGLFIVSDGNRSYAEYFDMYNSQKYFGEPTMEGFKVDRCVTKWMPLPHCCKSQ